MIKQIEKISEVGKELTLVFVTNVGCGFAKQVEPVFEAFAEAHPEVTSLKIMLDDPATRKPKSDVGPLALFGTPTFLFYKDGKLYNRVRGSDTILTHLNMALTEVESGVVQMPEGDTPTNFVKPTVLYVYNDGCTNCEAMDKNIAQFAESNPARRVWKIKISPELKTQLKIGDGIPMPILVMCIKSKPALGPKTLSGMKNPSEIQDWADKTELEFGNSCGGKKQGPPELALLQQENRHLKAALDDRDKQIAFLQKIMERAIK